MDQFVKQASALFPSLVVLVSFYTLTSFRITQGFNIDIPSVITHNGPGGIPVYRLCQISNVEFEK